MRTNLLINNFTKGELCKWMFGRTDVKSYSQGCSSLLNCLVRPFGGAMRRPGLFFLTETKTTGNTRLIPFEFSIEESFIIEVGVGYFRFYKDGKVIEKTLEDTDDWITSTDYKRGDFVKESSKIYYCINEHTSGTFIDDLTSGYWIEQSIYEIPNFYISSDIKNIKYAQSNDVLFMTVDELTPKKLSRYSNADWRWEDLYFENGPFLLENSTSTTIRPSGATGAITLTASSDIFESGHIGSYWSINQKKTVNDVLIQGVVQITGYNSPTSVTAVVSKTLYDTRATTIWAEGAWSDVRGFPKSITFHDSRLWFANTNTEPQKVWGSEVFVYNNFAVEEAVEVELPSNKLNSVSALTSSRDLIATTSGGIFVINGGSIGEVITSDNITAYQSSQKGSSTVQAQKIGEYVYYPQRQGEKLMEFKYSWENEGYIVDEISLINEDVLESGIKEMSLQEAEDNILYSVLNNGRIAALTRVVSQDVSALSPLETDGEFVSVASIYNPNQFWDDTYVIVRREINGVTKQYIERFSKPRKTELKSGIFCDSAVFYESEEGLTELTGLEHIEGKTVQILRDGSVEPEQIVTDGKITLLKTGYEVVVGLKYKSEISPMPYNAASSSFGSSQGMYKRPIYADIKLLDTMGIKIEGENIDEPVFVRDYTVTMGSPNPLKSGDVRVSIPKGVEKDSTIKIVQDNPLPMNILSITTKLLIQET